MSFAKFRNTQTTSALKEKFDALNGKRDFNDLGPTYWTTKHVAGPDGTGEAVIRFLPAPPDGNGGIEPDNIVKYFQYSIYRNGKAYVNRGRNSLGADEADPAVEYNKSIWSNKDLSKEEKKKLLVDRKIFYIANIYVVKDPNKPENEGKVFRWQFGQQIYDLINSQLFPKFETDEPVNVFDPIEGADFVFRVIPKSIPDKITGQLKKVPSYDESKFRAPSQRWSLEEFDEIWAQEHSLQSEVAEDKFKSYEELKAQFDRVMNSGPRPEIANQYKAATAKQEKAVAPKQEKSLKEELDGELPWVTDDTPSTSSSTDDVVEDLFSDNTPAKEDDEISDWFSSLGD